MGVKVGVTTGKMIAVGLLYATSVGIAAMGIGFAAYSLLNNVQIAVMQSTIPGAVFGAVVAFLGVRYIMAVRKLQAKVFKANAKFSWSHFKHQ